MKKIWKYALKDSDAEYEIPEGGRILSVQMQGGGLTMWALVDIDAKREKRRVTVYGTGHDLPPYPGRYVGTVQASPALVWHIFEKHDLAPRDVADDFHWTEAKAPLGSRIDAAVKALLAWADHAGSPSSSRRP